MGDEFAKLMGPTLEERPRELAAQVRARLGDAAVRPELGEERLRLLHGTVAAAGGPLVASWMNTDGVAAAAMGGDGTLYLNFWDGRMAAWNLDLEWEPRWLEGMAETQVRSIAVCPDSGTLGLGFMDGMVQGEGGRWAMHAKMVVAVAVSGGMGASMDYGGETKVWDWRTGTVLHEMEQGGEVSFGEYERMGFCTLVWAGELLLGHSLGQVTAWRWRTGRIAWMRRLDSLNEGAFALRPDGRMALVDGMLVRVEDGETVGDLKDSIPQRAAYSLDGSRLYTIERKDPRLWVRHGETGETIHKILTDEYAALLPAPGGMVVGIPYGYWDTGVRWWNGEARRAEGERHRRLRGVQLTEDGEWAVSWGWFGRRRWRVETGVAARPALLGAQAAEVGTSGDERFVLYELAGREQAVWDAVRQHGVTLPEPILIPAACDRGEADDQLDYSAPALCRISADGLFAAMEQNDQTVKLIRLADGKECARTEYRGRLRYFALGEGGTQGAYWSSGDGLQRLEWLGAGWEKWRMGEYKWTHGLSMSRDGQYLVTATGRTVQLWGREEEWASFTFDDMLRCCAISGNGRVVAVGDALERIHLLRVKG